MTKTKRNRLTNLLQHFLSYLMSPTLMENGKARRIKISTRGKLRVEVRLVIQRSNKPLWNQSTQENEFDYQHLKLKPVLLSRNPHMIPSLNLPPILHSSLQTLLPRHLMNANRNTKEQALQQRVYWYWKTTFLHIKHITFLQHITFSRYMLL